MDLALRALSSGAKPSLFSPFRSTMKLNMGPVAGVGMPLAGEVKKVSGVGMPPTQEVPVIATVGMPSGLRQQNSNSIDRAISAYLMQGESNSTMRAPSVFMAI